MEETNSFDHFFIRKNKSIAQPKNTRWQAMRELNDGNNNNATNSNTLNAANNKADLEKGLNDASKIVPPSVPEPPKVVEQPKIVEPKKGIEIQTQTEIPKPKPVLPKRPQNSVPIDPHHEADQEDLWKWVSNGKADDMGTSSRILFNKYHEGAHHSSPDLRQWVTNGTDVDMGKSKYILA